MNKKIAFTSLGCDKNRVDSEVMLGILQKNGYTVLKRTKDFNNIERAVLAQYGRKEEY